MKTKERNEIDEELIEERPNDIEDVLKQLAPYWRAIVGVLVLGVGGLIAFQLLSASNKAANEKGWSEYMAAAANRDASSMQAIAASGSGGVAILAQHSAAQAKLVEASAAVYRDRAVAKQAYEEALAGFTKSVAQSSGQDLVQRQSLWGLGQTHEGLNDLAKAKQAYQQIMDKWPDSAMAKQAKGRIESLSDPKTKEFYDWFFAQTPPALPASSEFPGLPSFEAPSSEPDFSMPEITVPGDSSEPMDDPADSAGEAATSEPAEEASSDVDTGTTETADAKPDTTAEVAEEASEVVEVLDEAEEVVEVAEDAAEIVEEVVEAVGVE